LELLCQHCTDFCEPVSSMSPGLSWLSYLLSRKEHSVSELTQVLPLWFCIFSCACRLLSARVSQNFFFPLRLSTSDALNSLRWIPM
jgi:hypothetical protein